MKNQILIKGLLVCALLFITGVVYAQTDPLDNEVDDDDEYIVYKDFKAGQRWGTWALNYAVPGLGSYVIMHDKAGGTTQLIMGIVSQALTIAGYITIIDGMNGDYLSYFFNSGNNETDVDEQKIMTGNIILAVGGVLSLANGIFNIFRSAFYHKPRSEIASLLDPTAWNIAVLPSKSGNFDRIQLSYTMRF